jgi:putative flippase GtrA
LTSLLPANLVRFGRYTIGSVVAFLVSELTLVVVFGTGLLGAAAASVVAFFAGAIPNYLLNRCWVWRQRGRIELRGELVPYVLISLATLGIAALTTTVAATVAPQGTAARTALVALAYFITYGLLFVGKFVAYQRFVFREPRLTNS